MGFRTELLAPGVACGIDAVQEYWQILEDIDRSLVLVGLFKLLIPTTSLAGNIP